MSVIYGLLMIVEVVVSILLIGVVFLQKSKSGMGGAAFGGGMGEAIFGSRMGNVLTKTTVVLAIVFLMNTVLLTMLTARRGNMESVTDLGNVAQPAAPMQSGGPVPMAGPQAIPEPVAVPEEMPMSTEMPAADAPISIPAVDAPVAIPADAATGEETPAAAE